MKFSPTLTLALALAAGLAGPAAAQTAATPASAASPTSQSTWNAAHPGSSYAIQPSSSRQAAGAPQSNTMAQRQMAPSNRPAANGNPQVEQAQERLQALGLYSGPSDGIMDPDTRAAIARFQEQHGLRRTESLNPQTMAALTSSRASGYGASAPTGKISGASGAGGYGAGGNTGRQPINR